MKGLLQWTDRQAPYRVNVQQVVTLDDLRRRIDELQRRHGTLGARLTGQSDPRWLACMSAVADALNLAERDMTEADLALTGNDPERALRRHARAGGHLQRAHDALTEWEAEYGG